MVEKTWNVSKNSGLFLSRSCSKTNAMDSQFVAIGPYISAEKFTAQPRAALDML